MANKKGVCVVTTITVKKVTGGWSRWGGGRRGLIKANTNGEWYCQSCATAHVPEDKPYMFELFAGEFIRICSHCLWIAKMNHAIDFLTLKQLVKRNDNPIDLGYDK